MSLAQRFERRLEGLVGGAFARVFKGNVEPVELGAALQREAGDKRNVMGAGQVMVPNRYRVTLSPTDFERLESWEAQLTAALAELVQEHIDENRWRTIGDVEVYLARDEALHTGVFGVASRMDAQAPPRRRPHDSLSIPTVQGAPPDAYLYEPANGNPANGYPANGNPANGYAVSGYPAAPQPAHGAPVQPAYAPAAPPAYAPPAPPAYGPSARPQFVPAGLVVDATGQAFDLPAGRTLIGRGTEADLQLLDQGVSRRHAEITYDGAVATVRDLGSTNGTSINGHPVASQPMRHGDVLQVGHTKLVFQQAVFQQDGGR